MPPAGLSELSILGGLMAGLASSLHCVGMCGGISASLMFTLSPNGSQSERGQTILLAQAGRVLAYVTAGAVLGAVSASVYLGLDRSAAHLVLRWAGAATLVYIGLSVAGWAPALAGLDRIGARLAAAIRLPVTVTGEGGAPRRILAPVLAGMVWGMMPCGMVYAALFYAMMAGNPGDGAAIMAGFGLGTLPAVTASAFGASALLDWAKRPSMRLATGLSIAAIGFASAFMPWQAIAVMCGIPVD